MRTYYDAPYLFEHRLRFLIWFSSDDGRPDGVVTDPNGKVPVFRTRQDLLAYTDAVGIELARENGSQMSNLDVARSWLKRKKPGIVDCHAFLAAWNLFGDVASSVGVSFEGDSERTNRIYQKLFWGNNLPSLTPPGKCYIPLWPRREIRLMRQVLGEGIALFRSRVQLQTLEPRD